MDIVIFEKVSKTYSSGKLDVLALDDISISRGQALVTESATISMQTKAGARILGIQIYGSSGES